MVNTSKSLFVMLSGALIDTVNRSNEGVHVTT